MIKLKFTSLLFLITISLHGQNNNWINYNQKYYKIPINKAGVYRITHRQLISSGLDPFFLSSIENKIQMFAKGKEIPIYINNLKHPNLGFIEFFIDKIDGELDSKMFSSSKEHLNPYIPIYSDTINCFLTWSESGPDGKRMIIETDVNFYNENYKPMDYCLVEKLDNANKSFKIGYSKGIWADNRDKYFYYGPKNFGYVTHFRDGRPKVPQLDKKTPVGNQNMSTPNIYSNGPEAILETRIDGCNNAIRQNFLIKINGENIINDTLEKLNSIEIKYKLPLSLIKNENTIYYENLNRDLGVISIAYTKITYPHTFDFENLNEMYFILPESQNEKDYIEISNFNPNNSTVRIYDLDAAKRVVLQPISGVYKGLISNFNNQARRCLITSDYMIKNVEQIIPVGTQSTQFSDYKTLAKQISKPNYLIITHPTLLEEAQKYAQYRNSKGFKTLLVDIEQLYLQYAWGTPNHPIAIRLFIEDLLEQNCIDPQYLFLIGKGLVHQYSKSNSRLNLVPTWSVLGSDVGFTSYLNGNDIEPLMATGRLAATTPNEVADYLEKIKQHESNILPAEWMKNIIHFIGGEKQDEQIKLKKYMDNFKSIAEKPAMGAKVHDVFKNSTSPIQINLSDSIKNLVNNGVTLMTFFGHAYGSNFDVNIDDPANFKNKGKYPLIIANSCLIGNIFENSKSSGSEKFVLSIQKGAIGFLGSANNQIDSRLNQYSSTFYNHFSNIDYGLSVGKIINNTIKKIQSKDVLVADNCNHMIFHGDPAIIMNSFPNPDYSIVSSDINAKPQVYTTPKIITTEIDSFDLHVIVKNIGKAQNDTFDIRVTRKFPQGNLTDFVLDKTVSKIYYKDTIVFRFPVDVLNGVGKNEFNIKIDVNNEIDEVTKNNNNLSYEVIIESSDINPVFPYEFAIISDYLPILKASTGKAFSAAQNYILEIDTSYAFDSPLKLSITKQSTGGVIEWSPEIYPELKTFFESFNSRNQLNNANVFFWRVAKDDNLKWRASSFQYVQNKTGWGQANWGQFAKNRFDFMNYIENPRDLNFVAQTKTLDINTTGNKVGYEGGFSIYYRLNGSTYSINSKNDNSLIVGVIDKNTLQPWNSQTMGDWGHNNYIKNFEPTWNNYSFDFGLTGDIQNLINFLNFVPDSNYIFMYNFNNHNLSDSYSLNNNLSIEFKNVMKSLGSNVDSIAKYPKYNGYIFFTQKGNPIKAKEITSKTKNEYLQLTQSISNNWLDGSMFSTKIGPGKNWKSLHWEVNPDELNNTQDTTQLFLYGLQDNGTTVLLLDTIAKQGDVLNLENLNIQQYKELQLQYYFVDPKERTPSKPIRWQVVHDEIPELALNALKITNYKTKDTLQQGESLYYVTAIQNISNVEMPAFSVQNWIISNTSSQKNTQSKMMKNLAPGEVIFDTVYVDTKDLQGLNSLWYEVNPRNGEYEWQSEKYHFNNTNLFSFFIQTDKINPVLDVAFDGIRILNGDIVSVHPEIVITLKDENPFLKLDDPSLMQVFIKYPNNFGDSTVLIPESAYSFIPASGLKNEAKIVFKHKFYTDGKYELGIMAKDKSRNISGKGHSIYDLKIQFEIVTKSSITQLINYPNPFSTSTRFVFILTGEQIPDEIRIQIMSITGKVVREINQDELGPINIGRNITEFAWDGKDQFGDQLANGVYFYRVIVKNNNEIVEERQQNINNASIKGNMSDKLFKQGYGKMYLMR